MKKLKVYILGLVGIVLIFPFECTHAQQATWIWYPGDYDIWLSNQMQHQRSYTYQRTETFRVPYPEY